jgi:hypothetical protein
MSAPVDAPVRPSALTRNRFMAMAGATLFGAAATLLKAHKAEGAPSVTPPYPCYGADTCPASGGVCCPGCTKAYTCSSAQCWTTCGTRDGRLYRCCDWFNKAGSLCICSSCGNCGPGC